jgi:hypothetical protein
MGSVDDRRRCRKVTGPERGRLAFCVLFAKSRYPGPRTTTDITRYRSGRAAALYDSRDLTEATRERASMRIRG